MLRINQIVKILGEMKAYAPYTYKSKTDKVVDKIHGRLVRLGVFIIALLALSSLYLLYALLCINSIVVLEPRQL